MKRFGLGFGLCIMGLVVVYLARTISVRDVVNLLLEADKRWVITFLLCSFVMSVGHAWRYLTLLAVTGYAVNPVLMYLVVLVRNLGSDLLPARLGTLVYVYLISNRLGVPLSAASSSFGYALIFDFVAIAPLILFASLTAIGVAEFSPLTLGLIGVCLLAVFAALVLLLPRLSKLASEQFADFSRGRFPRVSQFLSDLDQEVQKTSHAGVLGRVLVLSFVIRLFKYGGLYAFLMALMIPRGYGLSDIPPAKAFLGMVAAELSASLPISGIAGLGAYQGVWIAAFSLLGFPEKLAAITSVGHHLFTQVYGYTLGLIALGILALPFVLKFRGSLVTHRAGAGSLRFSVSLASFLLLVGVGALVVHAGERTAHTPVAETTLPSGDERLRVQFLSLHKIVFDSNRSGTFGIYLMGGGETSARVLTDNGERHEQFPAVSPDGSMIAYASARSDSRYAESEIWLLTVASGAKRRVAIDGTFPSFHPDGRSIIFERDRSRVMRVSLDGGKEQEIFPAKHARVFGRYQVVKPRISPDGRRVAFTSDREERWRAYVADLSTGQLIDLGHGCQPAFVSDTEALFVKNRGAKNEAGLYRVDLLTGNESVVVDAGAPGGKEYFPSSAGELLLYSEGAGDGEAVTFNLRGLLLGKQVPLTSDSASNRWPKLLVRDRTSAAPASSVPLNHEFMDTR